MQSTNNETPVERKLWELFQHYGLYFFSTFMILLNLIAFYHNDLYFYTRTVKQKIMKLKYAKTY